MSPYEGPAETVARMNALFGCGPDCKICRSILERGDPEDYDNTDLFITPDCDEDRDVA